MKEFSLYELYNLVEKMKSSDFYSEYDLKIVEELISKKETVLENTSATGGPAGAAGSSSIGVGSAGVALSNTSTIGMGGVVSSQPSAFPGALNGTAWISGGGQQGSGDISVPYNPSGANRVFQKLPAFSKRKEGDPNVITKKSRHKKLDMKTIKDMMSNKKSSGKIMNFNDFEKKDITTKVTTVKEGRTHDVAKKGKKETHDVSKFQADKDEEVKTQIGVIGENINISRIASLHINKGLIVSYIHNLIANDMGKIAVLIGFESVASNEKLNEIGKQIAMHIAAAKPDSLNIEAVEPAKVPEEAIDNWSKRHFIEERFIGI